MNNHLLQTDVQWQLKEQANEDKIKALSVAINVSPFIAQLLIQRGITTFEEAKAFFCPEMEQWKNPFLLKDMVVAVQRIQKALQANEKILIFGDYDADGVFSTAIVFDYLKNQGAKVRYFLPDRLLEGYGLSKEAIQFAVQKECSLMIVLDNGTTAHDKVSEAKKLGIDILIFDHHLPEKNLPLPEAFALVNPQRSDCSYPFKQFSAAGLALKLVDALSENQTTLLFEKYAAWATIATAADLVPMIGENRLIAFYGLANLNKNAGVGLEALIQLCELRKPLVVRNIVMQIAPKINAAGRIAKADFALDLLFENDQEKAISMARNLIKMNAARKTHTQMVIDEVSNQAQTLLHYEHGLVLYGHAWHAGVVGMAAARCTEVFCRPTVVLCLGSDGYLFGSARSHDNIDIIDVLEECSDYLIKFGGHRFAAGLSLNKENLEQFREKFNEACKKRFSMDKPTKIVKVDVKIDFPNLSVKSLQILRRFAPFGPDNMRPVFMVEKVRLKIRPTILFEKHLLLQLEQKGVFYQAIGYYMAERIKEIGKAEFLDVCFVVSGDEGEENKKRTQFELRDFKVNLS